LGRAFVALALGSLLLGAVPAGAADEKPEGWAYALAGKLMSPYCPGRTLSECPSPQADTLRMWIIVQESAGRSRVEVEEELIERFGEQILAAPRARGFGWAAYLIPVFAFLGGGAVVWLFLRRQTAPASFDAPLPLSSATVPTDADPELERRVEEELAR